MIHGIPLFLICVKCGKTVVGDPKYHEVYQDGKKIGYRHRKCEGINKGY